MNNIIINNNILPNYQDNNIIIKDNSITFLKPNEYNITYINISSKFKIIILDTNKIIYNA